MTIFLGPTEVRYPQKALHRLELVMGRTILICDYNEVDGYRLVQELNKLAHFVSACDNIESAIARFESGEKFDLMLFSHRLPHYDGIEGVASLRQTSESIGIVLVIDEPSDDTVFAGYRAGADMVLIRPVSAQHLIPLLYS